MECNWTAFEVFQRCEQTLVVGAGGAAYCGFAAHEVETVMRLLRVPRGDRLEVFDGARSMGRAWAEVRNQSKS